MWNPFTNKEERDLWNWEVKEKLVSYCDNDGSNGVVIPKHKAIVRSDNNHCLGVVSTKYHSLENRDMEKFCNTLEKAGATYENHGEFNDGRIIWAQYTHSDLPSLDMNEGKENTPEDKVKSKILVANGHAGEMSVSMMSTTIRIICQNTFIAAMQEGTAYFKQRHTKVVKDSVLQFQDKIEQMSVATKEVLDSFNRWNDIKITDDAAMTIVNKAIQIPELPAVTKKEDRRQGQMFLSQRGFNNRERAMLCYNQDMANGSLWGAFNAVTYYVDHDSGKRKDYYKDFGNGNLIKKRAYGLCNAYERSYNG